MVKAKTNYWMDILLLVTFIPTSITSIILFFGIDTGIKRATLVGVHDWFGLSFIILGLLHFLFHWKWFIGFTKKILKK